MRAHTLRRTTFWLATALSLACAGNSVTGVDRAPGPGVASIDLSPSAITLVVGTEAPLQVTLRDESGHAVTGVPVVWSVKDTTIARVSSSGVVSARGVGNTQVAASAGGVSAIATLSVQPPPVSSVVVQPLTQTLVLGQSATLSATPRDVNGTPLTGRVITWASSNEAVATVSQAGEVASHAVGSATITATSEGVSGSATVTITPVPVARVAVQAGATTLIVGNTTTLTARAFDANGGVLDRAVTWTSDHPDVATVSETGVVTAVAPGSATITAQSEGQSSAVTITVTRGPVSSIAITPGSASLVVGGTTTFAAAPKDASGAALADRAVSWSSSVPTVATVSPSGSVTAVAPGTTTITATSEGVSASATVTVGSVPVGSVAVSPSALTLVPTQVSALGVVVRDANNVVVTDRAVTWASSNTGVATVSTSGAVTAVAPGTAIISASSGGKTASATITVVPMPVGSVAVTPTTATVTAGQATQLTATVRDTSGRVVTDRAVTWRSSDATIATVSAAGVVTGVRVGGVTITATSEGVSGSAAVTVTLVAVGSVTVQPASANLTVGDATPLSATVRDAGGNVVADRVVTWASSDIRIATVSPTGVVTAVAPGSATISATSEGKFGTSTVTVVARPVASVAVQPATASVTVGGVTTLTATASDAVGTVVPDAPMTWTSSNVAVATVSPTGVVTGRAPGTATISATSSGHTGSATVTVIPVPVGSVVVTPSTLTLVPTQVRSLGVVVRDANNVIVTDRPVTWASSNPAVATVSANGVVTALAPGTTTVSATSEGRTGSATVTVVAMPVGSVSVSPSATTVTAGETTVLVATVRDTSGAVVTDRTVTWRSSDATIATVSAAGVVTAMRAGIVTISATSEGVTGSAAVTVTQVPVGSVTVQPSSTSVTVGDAVTLSTTVRDTAGTVVTNRVVTWASSDIHVAVVSASGVVTGVAPGSVTISATSEGKVGTSTVTVTPRQVATVTVQPATTSVQLGGTTTLTATARDGGGTVIPDADITWTSSDVSVATVSSTGIVTAVALGTATISATSNGHSGSSSVTVIPVPVGSVTVTPSTLTLVRTETRTLDVVVRDANNVVVTDRVVTWASSNPAVATVSSTGVVTAVAPGSATVTATSEGRSGSSTVTVVPMPVGSVAVAPTTATVMAGQTTQLTATVRDTSGTVVTDRAVVWSSSDPTIATVSAAGVVTGVNPGTVTISATSEGVAGSATVTITPIPVATVTLQPTSVTLEPGQTSTLTATTKGADGTVLTGRVVTFASDNESVARVSSTGVVTAVAVGTANITATSEGRSATTVVTVQPAVASVNVSPSTVVVRKNSTVQLTVTAYDASGHVITGRAVTWTSSDTERATVSSTGLVTAKRAGPGAITITATIEGHSDSSQVTITN